MCEGDFPKPIAVFIGISLGAKSVTAHQVVR